MLKIEVNNSSLDLGVDTSLTFSFENPLFLVDKIPVEHTLSLSIPRTVNNSNILNWGYLMNSKSNFSNRIECRVYFGACLLSSGCLFIEDAAPDEFTVQFVGAILPPNIREPLYKQSFGKMDFGTATKEINSRGYTRINTKSSQQAWNKILSDRILQFTLDAPVIAFKDSDKLEGEGSYASNFSTHISKYYLNYFNNFSYMTLYGVNENIRGNLSKILVSFSVDYILKMLIGEKLQGMNPFETDLDDLFLISTWHPKYNNQNNSLVFDIDDNLNVSLSFSDFFPNVPANEFIVEMLKLTCSSMYIKGDLYIWEQNSNILNSVCSIDWSDKFLDDYSILQEQGCYYNIGFAYEDLDATITDAKIIEVQSIAQMVTYPIPDIGEDDGTLTYFYVRSTNQYFEIVCNSDLSTLNRPHYDYKLIKQDLGTSKINKTDDNRSSFDVTINAEIVKTEVVTIPFQNLPVSGSDVPSGISLYKRFWCPVIEQTNERSSSLLLGRSSMSSVGNDNYTIFQHPTISHSAYDITGFKRPGIINLSFTGEDNFYDAYHLRYKQWVEKDKRVIKGKLLLSVLDLHTLDLRKKVNVHGVECFVRKIDLTINVDSIEPADVELVEV